MGSPGYDENEWSGLLTELLTVPDQVLEMLIDERPRLFVEADGHIKTAEEFYDVLMFGGNSELSEAHIDMLLVFGELAVLSGDQAVFMQQYVTYEKITDGFVAVFTFPEAER